MEESATDVKASDVTSENATVVVQGTDSTVLSGNILEDLNLYYEMSGDKYLLIFNHFEYKRTRYFGYSHPSPRNGTHEDVKSLRRTFEGLGFKVTQHQDLEYESIIDEVIAVTKADHTSTSCVIVAILTHGSTGGELSAYDRPYNLSDILILFEKGHPKLVTIPKLFFIQACRGDSMDAGRVVTDSQARHSYLLPTHANFLILYSTVEDYVSWRDIRGSWLIQELCSVVEEFSTTLDFVQMLSVVNYRVARERASYSLRKILNDKKQMPETRFTLTKLLRI